MIKIGSKVWCWKNGLLVYSGQNLVTTSGLGLIASLVAGGATVAPGYMAIGTDGSTTTANMTTLQGTEIQRKSFTSATAVGATVTFSTTFGENLGTTQTVQEYGIFNSTIDGIMLSRFLSSPVVLDPGDAYDVVWALDFEYVED